MSSYVLRACCYPRKLCKMIRLVSYLDIMIKVKEELGTNLSMFGRIELAMQWNIQKSLSLNIKSENNIVRLLKT